jgi:glycosyltransferase involved in cell wall biosynthesis
VTGIHAPLRVAQLIEAMDAGGAEALAVDIAGALAARGHVSHLIVARGDGPFRSRVAAGVAFHDLDRPRNDGNQAFRLAYFLGTCRRLDAHLRAHRIEVLQTHLPKANFLGLAMAWRGVCRVYPTVHNNREFDYGDSAGPLRRAARREAYRRMLSGCRAVIAVSDQVRESLAQQLAVPPARRGRIVVVPNGVRLPHRPDDATRSRWRAEQGVAADQVLVVGAGRLTRQKNFSRLVEALALLGPNTPDWRCVIAGEGELKSALEAQVAAAGLAGRITLPGLVENLPSLLAAADVFCLPSLFEGLPLVLLEAMGAGLPTAAFAIDGVTDVVADGVHARLASADDAASLAAALGALLADTGERRRLGEAARRAAEAKHGFATVVDRLEGIYWS